MIDRLHSRSDLSYSPPDMTSHARLIYRVFKLKGLSISSDASKALNDVLSKEEGIVSVVLNLYITYCIHAEGIICVMDCCQPFYDSSFFLSVSARCLN